MKWLLPLLLCLIPLTTTAAERPNLLIITVDDMSADSLGCFGCPLETSPHIDQLAKRGLRFEYAHVQVGNCMPSRNVMWSGRYPHNTGVEGFYQVKNPDFPVLSDLMQQAGYFTGIRGKASHSTPYHPYPWDINLDTSTTTGEKHHIKDAESYGTSMQQGIEAAAQAEKPFCLMMNVSDPHKPFYATGKRGETVPDPFVPSQLFSPQEVPIPKFLFEDAIVRKELSQYYNSVRRADDCVGEILQALEDSGKTEETFILFLSDHGMPLPFAKTQVYHHSTKTPLIVVWPGVTKPGSHDQTHMVSAVDFLPTLLDVVGADHPDGLNGRSFAELLQGKSQSDREYVVKEYHENAGASRDPMRAVQTKRFLYIFNPWSNGKRVFATATTGTLSYRRLAQLAREESWFEERHDLYQHRVPEELYDVNSDPACLHNLIDVPELQQELNQLRSELEQWMVNFEDPLLEVFRKRDNEEFRETYMQKIEAQALERRKSSQNKNNNPVRNDVISLKHPRSFQRDQPIQVTINYQLPQEIESEQLQVTIKSGQNLRIERKIVTISGDGVEVISFQLPDDYQESTIRIAAFVGPEYSQHLQHVLTKPIKLRDDQSK